MKRFLLFVIALALVAGQGAAVCRNDAREQVSTAKSNQSPASSEERGLVALDQALREIANPITIMCVAAHPDDADYGTLAYYHKKLGARAVIVFATRGENGDSITRSESGDELGALRTRESLAAARAVGADVYFLNFKDFGYSKSATEALNAWGRDEALQKMILAIRLLKPDVIITRHDSKSGEGQHQAISRLTAEAFDLAGDTKKAPAAGSEPWQPRRFFRSADEATEDVTVNLSEYDHARGRTYTEIARDAYRKLTSYEPGLESRALESEKLRYKLALSSSGERLRPGATLIDEIALPENLARSIRPPVVGETTLIKAITERDKLVESLREKLAEKRAEGPTEDLRARYGSEFFRVVRFTESLERALALALGLRLEVDFSDRVIAPGEKAVARIALRNGGDFALPVAFHLPDQVSISGKTPEYKMTEVAQLGPSSVIAKEIEYEIPKTASPTLPHAARLYDEQYYPIGSALPGAIPQEPFGHSLLIVAEVQLESVTFTLASLARLDTAPAVEISTIPFALIQDWSKQREIEFDVMVRNRTRGALSGALWVVPLALSEDNYEPVHIVFSREDEEAKVRMKLRLPVLKPPLAPDILIEFRRERPAPPDPLGSTKIQVKAVEYGVAEGLQVAYIKGASSWIEFALTQLGVAHSKLSVDEIQALTHASATGGSAQGCSDLSKLDAIIVDEGAYFLSPELMARNNCLLSYVEKGGTLVVFSQQPDDLNLIVSRSRLAPFPLALSRNRITDEVAPVRLLDESHNLMSKPNRITTRDFEGWMTERATYLPRQWAEGYTPLIETADAGEDPQQGSLLVAKFGEGAYIYVSLALRRQLLEVNGGAYRLFANLISYRKTQQGTSETK